MDSSFWRGKRVFVTGHTGFKGGWLVLLLRELGADLAGYALEPSTSTSLFEEANIAEIMVSTIGDIRDMDKLKSAIIKHSPEIIFHLAAQPLVRLSYRDPVETYSTNVMGLVNLFEVIRLLPSVRATVNVTTDKCYENKEWLWGYRETDRLGGWDPYSSSKACAELVTTAYQRSFFSTGGSVKVATCRAGNVIGGGDWALDRLIPDAIRALENGSDIFVRNPSSIRPWQHVLEPLTGYLLVAQGLYEYGNEYAEPWNFGPSDKDAVTVAEVITRLVHLWGDGTRWVRKEAPGLHEANYLKLDINKARSRLNWNPRWDLDRALLEIVAWHKAKNNGANVRDVTTQQIKKFLEETKFGQVR